MYVYKVCVGAFATTSENVEDNDTFFFACNNVSENYSYYKDLL